MTENSFAHNITLLRNQRGLSQKQVARSLGVSQALLSHYEKGVRECGLDFLVRIADFYGVTADYLLGRTRAPQNVSQDDQPADGKLSSAVRYRRAISAALDIIFDLLSRCQNSRLTEHTADYLALAVYRMYRVIYSANSDEPDEPFGVSKYMSSAMNDATMRVVSALADHTAETSDEPEVTFLSLSADAMSSTYEKKLPQLKKVLVRAEQKMLLPDSDG